MTFFKVDDGMWDHPKFERVSHAAIALWTRAGSWCCRYLTDGVFPIAKLSTLKHTKAQASQLVAAGLWVESGSNYVFRDWSHYQFSKSTVEAKREKDRARHAAKSQGKAAISAASSRGTPERTRGELAAGPWIGEEISSSLSQISDARPENSQADRRDSREPGRHLMALEMAIGAEYSRRRVGGKRAAPSQYLEGCRRVDDHVRDGHFGDAQAAILALAKAVVEESIKPGGQKLGFALADVSFAPAKGADVMAARRAIGVTYVPRGDE